MTDMYAVVQKEPAVLVAVFLTKGDANVFLDTINYNGGFSVEKFDLDWGHWIEYRKTLGIY